MEWKKLMEKKEFIQKEYTKDLTYTRPGLTREWVDRDRLIDVLDTRPLLPLIIQQYLITYLKLTDHYKT